MGATGDLSDADAKTFVKGRIKNLTADEKLKLRSAFPESFPTKNHTFTNWSKSLSWLGPGAIMGGLVGHDIASGAAHAAGLESPAEGYGSAAAGTAAGAAAGYGAEKGLGSLAEAASRAAPWAGRALGYAGRALSPVGNAMLAHDLITMPAYLQDPDTRASIERWGQRPLTPEQMRHSDEALANLQEQNRQTPDYAAAAMMPAESNPQYLQQDHAYGGGVRRADGGGLSGPLLGATDGRADDVNTSVPNGSHIIPADIVSALGEGNSVAGAAKLGKMFPNSRGPKAPAIKMGMQRIPAMPRIPQQPAQHMPHILRNQAHMPRMPHMPGMPKGLKHGGNAAHVPVRLSDGEFAVHPLDVARSGGGNIERGHRALNHWIMTVRKEDIERRKKLPGPV